MVQIATTFKIVYGWMCAGLALSGVVAFYGITDLTLFRIGRHADPVTPMQPEPAFYAMRNLATSNCRSPRRRADSSPTNH